MGKIKLKKKNENEEPTSSYKQGAELIGEYVDNFIKSVYVEYEKCPVQINPLFFRDKMYRNANDFTYMVDRLCVEQMERIKNDGVMDKPFEYLLFGAMMAASRLEQDDQGFDLAQAASCRLIDTHQYFVDAKNGDQNALKELAKRGWMK